MFQLVNLKEKVTEFYFCKRTESIYTHLYILTHKLDIFIFYPRVIPVCENSASHMHRFFWTVNPFPWPLGSQL